MSLPPGFLDELRSRTSLAQVVGRKVMWDKRKSVPAKGDLWAPCPFHQEKTASFHVEDRKGFYYCFGCHQKGDAISFVRETENVGFMEAVEILAREAGMTMPAADPRAREKADRQTQLAEVTEAALNWFRLQLKTGAAAEARAYLDRRGLAQGLRDRFELGFASPGWRGLWEHLSGKGIAPELILAAGLAKASDKGGQPYDIFRNRIIFPIRDAHGRAIGFGGRTMEADNTAKYINSPETALFDKGRTLYNAGPARTAAGKGQTPILAEGYMDVIALVGAGFEAAVAPLGTAVTEHQLQLLWRLGEEPVVALDGDRAGLRSAYRLTALALPLMEAGRSLRFALLPEGKDPDDLIKAEGAAGMQAVLEAALPMVRLVWREATEGRVIDSPERRAALDRDLAERIKAIRDPRLRHHYGEEIKRLRWELFRPARGGTGGGAGGPRRAWGGWKKGAPPPLPPQETTKASLLASAGPDAEIRLREAVILAAILTTPEILGDFETALDTLVLREPDHAALRDALLRAAPADRAAALAAAEAAIGPATLESLLGARHVAVVPCIRRPGDAALARLTVAEEFAKLSAAQGLEAELAEAVEDLQADADETVTWRLGQAAEARAQAVRAAGEDDVDYELGANGARIDRSERESFAALLDTIRFTKTGR
ncbi:DNA primase [Roseivivax sp. CAU 1761]